MTQDETRDEAAICDACGRPQYPDHDANAPGPTVKHPFRARGNDTDDEEQAAELSALRAENERLALLLNDANTRLDERRKMCDEYELDLAQSRRDLEEAKVENERLEKLHDASVKVLAAHVDQVRAGKVRCGHPDHAQAGTGDTTQPGDDVIDRAARDLHRWNTEDTWHPRFVIHDLGDQDEDPYVALVRKVAGLLTTRPDTQDSAALEVDDEAGAWYVRLLDEDVAQTVEMVGPNHLDFTRDGRLIGVEILPPDSARPVTRPARQEPDQGNGDTEGWQPLLGAWVTGTIMPDNQRAGEEMTGAWFGWGTDEHRVGWIDDEIGTISSIWPVRPDTLRPAAEAKGQDAEHDSREGDTK